MRPKSLSLYAPTRPYSPRAVLAAEEQAQLDASNSNLVESVAKVAHRLYEFCKPFFVPNDAQSPPEEILLFFPALMDAVAGAQAIEVALSAAQGETTTPPAGA